MAGMKRRAKPVRKTAKRRRVVRVQRNIRPAMLAYKRKFYLE